MVTTINTFERSCCAKINKFNFLCKKGMSQKIVEKWCRKRRRCWSLPLSVFAPAVIYDNWFRCMCRFYSRELILQDPEHIGVYSTCYETSYISEVAETAEIKNYCENRDDKEEFFVTMDKNKWRDKLSDITYA